VTLETTGAGRVTLSNLRAMALTVSGGTVEVQPENGTSVLGALSIAGATGAWTATCDLANNDAIIQSSAANKTADFNRMYDQIKSGYAAGAWNGTGINRPRPARPSKPAWS
jgi:hypothetical protein